MESITKCSSFTFLLHSDALTRTLLETVTNMFHEDE